MNRLEAAAAAFGISVMELQSRFELIGSLLEKGIEQVNTSVDVKKVFEEVAYGEDRTVMIYVYGYPDGYLFRFNKNAKTGAVRVERVETSYSKPTVTVSLMQDTLICLATGKTTFDDLVWSNEADISGDYYARDTVVFKELFKQFGYFCQEMGLFS